MPNAPIQEVLKGYPKDILKDIQFGIEKESLRVTKNGHLAKTTHPKSFGAALTNSWITTDYSESLLEFITKPSPSLDKVFSELSELHQFVYQALDDELLWVGSMPCAVTGEEEIPIATYGDSNIGQMKHLYRKGLSHRYGSRMQILAGIHFNFSLPDVFWQTHFRRSNSSKSLQDFITDNYLGLMRNFLRHCWILPFLFGASPAADTSFTSSRRLQHFDEETVFLPFATSLRMSDVGYQNHWPQQFNVSYNTLPEYLGGLIKAMNTPVKAYEKWGDHTGTDIKQLSNCLLQISNEYYSVIRPKSVAGESLHPTENLRHHGIGYIEVRLLDLNPFEPTGVDKTQSDFMTTFLLFCLFSESSPLTHKEQQLTQNAFQSVVTEGRNPNLKLKLPTHATEVTFFEAAQALLNQMQPIAEYITDNTSANGTEALAQQRSKLKDTTQTPSAKLLSEMKSTQSSYQEYMLKCSKRVRNQFIKQQLSPEKNKFYQAQCAESLKQQNALEQGPQASLEEYLTNYYAAIRS